MRVRQFYDFFTRKCQPGERIIHYPELSDLKTQNITDFQYE
jgi:hypothetical protein